LTPQTLCDKLWDSHAIHVGDDGTMLLYIDRHPVHAVTGPRAEREGLDRIFRDAGFEWREPGISSMCAVGVKRRSA